MSKEVCGCRGSSALGFCTGPGNCAYYCRRPRRLYTYDEVPAALRWAAALLPVYPVQPGCCLGARLLRTVPCWPGLLQYGSLLPLNTELN